MPLTVLHEGQQNATSSHRQSACARLPGKVPVQNCGQVMVWTRMPAYDTFLGGRGIAMDTDTQITQKWAPIAPKRIPGAA